jgi:hypothetical protein
VIPSRFVLVGKNKIKEQALQKWLKENCNKLPIKLTAIKNIASISELFAYYKDIQFGDVVIIHSPLTESFGYIEMTKQLRKEESYIPMILFCEEAQLAVELINEQLTQFIQIQITTMDQGNWENEFMQILKKVDTIYANLTQDSNRVFLPGEEGDIVVYEHEISYFESVKDKRNRVLLHLDAGEELIKLPFKKIREFCLNHSETIVLKSYIINERKIRSYKPNCGYIEFVNGERLYLGKKLILKIRQNMKKQLLDS